MSLGTNPPDPAAPPSAATSPSSPASEPYFTPPPPPAAPPKPRRNTMWLAIGAVVVVAIVVLGLGLAGILPIFSSGSSSPSVLTYSQALPIANGAAQGTAGGSWALILSSGLVSPVAAFENLNFTKSSGCAVTLLSGAPHNVSLSAGPSNPAGGSSPNWLFLYRNADEALLIVGVLDGKATAFATIASGQSCSSLFGLFVTIPSNVIDSSAAANAVSSDASAFLSAHPNVTARFSVFGGASLFGLGKVGAEWAVNYTTCSVNAAAGTSGSAFNATVNATSGAVVFEQTISKLTCTSTGSLGLVHGSASRASVERQLDLGTTARRV